MRKFSEWIQQINESMDVYVQGYDYHSDIRDLDDICRQLKYKAIDPFWAQLSKEGQEAVRQSGSAYHTIIAPDGSYYGGEDEVINFYAGGWPENLIPKMLKAIKYYLDELHVKYEPFKLEQSGMYKIPVYRIKVIDKETTKGAPPQLNLSNQNARLIFHDLLEFPEKNDGGFFQINPHDLYIKIEELENWKPELHAREPYQTGYRDPIDDLKNIVAGKEPKTQVNFYQMGLSAEQIRERLEIIKQIAKYAIDNGYPEIYVT